MHTHTRRLDYHPYVHVIIRNDGLSKNKTFWQARAGDYLCNSRALATVFLACVLKTLYLEFELPETPKQWIVHCKKVARGLPGAQYLSRYLYRRIFSEKKIFSNQDGQVNFGYRDNKPQSQTRTLSANYFLKLVLQHLLPQVFRRVCDIRFLHGNVKQTLKRVQWALQVDSPKIEQRERPVWHCKYCGGAMHIFSTYRRRLNSGYSKTAVKHASYLNLED